MITELKDLLDENGEFRGIRLPNFEKIKNLVVKYPPCYRGNPKYREILSIHEEYSGASKALQREEEKLFPWLKDIRLRIKRGEKIPEEESRARFDDIYINYFSPMVRIEVQEMD